MGTLEARGAVPREEGELKGHIHCHLPTVCTMHTLPDPHHSVISSSRVCTACLSIFTHFSLQLNPETHQCLSVFVKH